MSECSICENLILGENYIKDRCKENNPIIKHHYRLHYSLFKDCLNFKKYEEEKGRMS